MLLTDTLIALTASLGMVAGAITAWDGLRATQQSLQTLDQMLAQQRQVEQLLTRLSLSAGATTLGVNTSGQVFWVGKPVAVEGVEAGGYRDDTFLLRHARKLDPKDCQGNQLSMLDHIGNHFKLSSKHELSCKDSLREGTLYQALAERVEDLQMRYAEVLHTAGADRMHDTLQWKTADQVSDWRQVQAFELCLRWATPQRVLQGNGSTPGCQGENISRDGRLRRVWRQVFWLASQSN
jgi:hypothetical protein